MDYPTYVSWAAQQYGADPGTMTRINKLEDGGKSTFDLNNWDSNAKKGTPSGGPFQFIEPTFKAYAAKAQKANPAAWKGVALDWRNPQAQALAASWAVANGHGSAWSTYDRAKKGGGAAPAAAPSSGGGYGITSGAAFKPSTTFSSMFQGGNKSDQWFGQFVDRQLDARRAQSGGVSTAAAGNDGAVLASGKPVVGGDYKAIEALGAKYGLNVQGDFQTTGGQHSKGSLHYAGKAVDFGDATNSKQKLLALAAYARAHPGQFKEFYYNPLGWGIRDGKVIKGLTVPGHDDHEHVGYY